MSAVKPFLLVGFIEPGKKYGEHSKKSVDIIPSNWLLVDAKNNHSCKFMTPPYSQDDQETLAEFIAKRINPIESWPPYPVKIRGHAGLYLILRPSVNFHRVDY